MKAQDLKFLTVAAVVALGLGLAGCSSSSDSGTASTPPPDPGPTAYEMALSAINGAETAEAAQAAYDAVDQSAVTGEQSQALQTALAGKLDELQTAVRIADQKMALMDAAGMIDTSDLSTQELVDAANEGIRALRQALEDADDVSDADKAMYMSTLDDAVDAVDGAQDGIDTATRRTNQMAALSGTSETLQAALAALSGSTPTQAQLDAANSARTALMTAITDAADLTDAEKTPYQHEADNAAGRIGTAQTAFDDAEDEATKTANAAMAALAAKLYTGIGNNPFANTTSFSGSDPTDPVLTVTIGGAGQALKVDKDATVAAVHGWEGARWTASGTGVSGTYEAVGYRKETAVEDDEKFNEEYTLDATTGETAALVTDTTFAGRRNQGRIASSSFDHTAGKKEFKLPENTVRVVIPGMYHGVSGNYYCAPAASSTCAVQVSARGFQLGGTADAGNAFTAAGGTWTFKPTDPETVIPAPIEAHYVFGWWLRTAADGTLTVGALDDRTWGLGGAPGFIDSLRGKATYRGGAAGQYALASPTGGTNDAGAFTARAMLEADFTRMKVSGTIDQFMGADGMAREWTVKLNESDFTGGGVIGRHQDRQSVEDLQETVWTIGETAADAGGQWKGNFYNRDGTDGAGIVPNVAMGLFWSTYGRDGRMVGGFGTERQ